MANVYKAYDNMLGARFRSSAGGSSSGDGGSCKVRKGEAVR